MKSWNYKPIMTKNIMAKNVKIDKNNFSNCALKNQSSQYGLIFDGPLTHLCLFPEELKVQYWRQS